MKVLIGVNVLDSVCSWAYSNHIGLLSRVHRDFPKDHFLFFTPDRMSIDMMRNKAAAYALEAECDYLMFVDDDVLVPTDTLSKLLARDKDIIMGLTFIRSYPYKPMFFKKISQVGKSLALGFYDDYKDHTGADGLVECYAVGFSCVLIKTEILRKIPPPYFVTGNGHTEDVYFCCKAKDYIENVSIFTDTTVKCTHLVDKFPLNEDNVEALREFNERIFNIEPERNPDRGTDYVEALLRDFEDKSEPLLRPKSDKWLE